MRKICHSSSRRQCHLIETEYRNCIVVPYSFKQLNIPFTVCQITLPDIKCQLRLILIKLHTLTDISIFIEVYFLFLLYV